MSRAFLRLAPAWALLVAIPALAQDNTPGKKNSARPDRKATTPATRKDQFASGVIIKAEPIRKGAASRSDTVESGKRPASGQQLTINTAAVWRDWVRDQAEVNVNATASPREIAARGANSVATRGEPRSEDTEVVIDLGPNTKVNTRFRASTDGTSDGAATPAGASRANDETAAGNGKEKVKDRSPTRDNESTGNPRATRFQLEDLKPGLFVEIEYRHEDGRNSATIVNVLRPVGGPDTPSETGAEPGKTKAKAKGRK